KPQAISFAFPGPADYKNGIIGDLINLPSFKGGVALGPMLENIFDLPTFINNDGDLFAYGEAIAGILLELNKDLKAQGITKKYNNLFGITLGTGFGGGIVINQNIFEGDNSAAGEIWLMRDFKNTNLLVEESVSIRAIQRVYKEVANCSKNLSPKDIFLIAMGKVQGNQKAALAAFSEMSLMIGESLANAITLIDGPIVVGGGISGASQLIIPGIVNHLNGYISNLKGEHIQRLVSQVYNMDDHKSYTQFLSWNSRTIKVPFSDKELTYNPEKRIVIGLSRLGTSKAVCLGAYAFALSKMDNSINRTKGETSLNYNTH
ncbi:MAG TPA: ROK family protein, partial [Flavobacteriaceae bacterium]|nr:ROK family protein [Flavobacteriaceae bacterium]